MKHLVRWPGVLVGLCIMAGGWPVCAQQEAAEDITQTFAEEAVEEAPWALGSVAADTGGTGDTWEMSEPPEMPSETTTIDPEASPGGDQKVRSAAGLISVDFKDADIRQVLRIVAIKSGIDIVAGTDVEGLVTIKLTDIPWEQALDIILRTYGFTYERKGRIIRVMTVQSLEEEALATAVFPLNYASAADVPDIINEMLSDRGRVRFDERTNTIIVTDVPSNLTQIEQVIARVDQRTPQVLIESKIIETRLERDEHLGIRWEDALGIDQTQTTIGTSFPFKIGGTLGSLGNRFLASPITNPTAITLGTLTGPDFDVTMNFLMQRTDVKIVSNPSLAVLNNQEARIHIGEDFPVPTFSVDPSTGNTTISGFETRTLGTILTVTPHVNPAKEIVVDLAPEVVSLGDNATFQVGDTGEDTISLPRFNTQTVTTQVRVASGHTIAIGGLVRTIEFEQVNKVPVLGDLPIIGKLFRNYHRFGGAGAPTSQLDLLIFLTVHLMEEDDPDAKPPVASAEQDNMEMAVDRAGY